jgi:hypothetical protein
MGGRRRWIYHKKYACTFFFFLLCSSSLFLVVDGFFSPTTSDSREDISFVNEMQTVAPISLSLEKIYGKSSLAAGHSFDVPVYIRAEGDTSTHFKGLLTYCKVCPVMDSFRIRSNGGAIEQKDGPVFFTRVARAIEVIPILSISNAIVPRPSTSQSYALRMEVSCLISEGQCHILIAFQVENITDELEVDLDHINALATEWRMTSKVASRLLVVSLWNFRNLIPLSS